MRWHPCAVQTAHARQSCNMVRLRALHSMVRRCPLCKLVRRCPLRTLSYPEWSRRALRNFRSYEVPEFRKCRNCECPERLLGPRGVVGGSREGGACGKSTGGYRVVARGSSEGRTVHCKRLFDMCAAGPTPPPRTLTRIKCRRRPRQALPGHRRRPRVTGLMETVAPACCQDTVAGPHLAADALAYGETLHTMCSKTLFERRQTDGLGRQPLRHNHVHCIVHVGGGCLGRGGCSTQACMYATAATITTTTICCWHCSNQ